MGDYSFDKFCLEPTSFKVKDETQFKDGRTEFVDTKLMTRLTYSLDDMSGKIKVNGDGKISFAEEGGVRWIIKIIELFGGGRVPFLFTVKQLNAVEKLSKFI